MTGNSRAGTRIQASLSLWALVMALAGGCSSMSATLSHQDFPDLPASQPIAWKTQKPDSSGGGDLLVPIKFDGHEETCLLDTGATSSIVFGNPFFKGYSPHSTAWMWGISGEKIPAYVIEFDTVDVGGRVLKHLPMIRDDHRELEGARYSCVVGLDVLGGGTLVFDFRKGTFQILREIPKEIATSELTVYTTGHFAIPIQVGSAETLGLWDSGASLTFFDPNWILAHPTLFERIGEKSQGYDISSRAKFELDYYRVRSVRVGQSTAREIFAGGGSLGLASNLRSDALIGFNLISRFNWMFDLRRARWARF